MNRVLLSLTLAFALAIAPRAFAQEIDAATKIKADLARTEGMKAAQADIAKGLLKYRATPPQPPLAFNDQWYEGYRLRAKHECGIEIVDVKPDVAADAKRRAEMEGYNAVMLVEIEHRFCKDILGKLAQQAKHQHILAITLSPLLVNRSRPEIKGALTVHGTVIKIKEHYAVQVGADYATFVLDQLSRTDTRMLDGLLGKEIVVKGSLRTDATMAPQRFVIDVREIKANGSGPFGHKVEGEVTIHGMLTKDLCPGLHYREPVGFKAEAFFVSQFPAGLVAPVRFSGDAAKQAENLYGRNVTLQCTLTSYGLGTRGQCFVLTAQSVRLESK